MKGFLLDTSVVSERRKGPRGNPQVSAWFESVADEELFLSVLVVGEIRYAVELARPNDPSKARALETWLTGLQRAYGDHLLPITPTVADEWGRLAALRPLATTDGLLAATALVHNLTFVTSHVTDVAHTGVTLLNPFNPA